MIAVSGWLSASHVSALSVPVPREENRLSVPVPREENRLSFPVPREENRRGDVWLRRRANWWYPVRRGASRRSVLGARSGPWDVSTAGKSGAHVAIEWAPGRGSLGMAIAKGRRGSRLIDDHVASGSARGGCLVGRSLGQQADTVKMSYRGHRRAGFLTLLRYYRSTLSHHHDAEALLRNSSYFPPSPSHPYSSSSSSSPSSSSSSSASHEAESESSMDAMHCSSHPGGAESGRGEVIAGDAASSPPSEGSGAVTAAGAQGEFPRSKGEDRSWGKQELGGNQGGGGQADEDREMFSPSISSSRSTRSNERRSLGGLDSMGSATRVITWGGRLPSKRRVILGSTAALGLALGGNLAGITSAILGVNENAARQLRLDTLFPVNGFRRCIDQTRGFEFIYPARWLGDQRLLYRAVEREEEVRSLDPPPLKERERKRRGGVLDPVVAFGPPGGTGEENVSVVVSPVPVELRLEQFGSPLSVGRRLLDRLTGAPQGRPAAAAGVPGRAGGGGEGGGESGRKEAELIRAGRRLEGPRGKGAVLYYDLEYTVKTDRWFRHNRSVFASVDGRLYSMNAQTPQTSWPECSELFEIMACSFRVLPPRR